VDLAGFIMTRRTRWQLIAIKATYRDNN